MVDVSSQNNQTKVSVKPSNKITNVNSTTEDNKINANATPDTAMYYSEVSKNWAKQSEKSAEKAAESAKNASEVADSILNNENIQLVVDNMELIQLASENAQIAQEQVILAQDYASSASESSTIATEQATIAKESAELVSQQADIATTAALNAGNSAERANNSANLAQQYMQSAEASALEAKTSETNAKTSATEALEAQNAASVSASSASTSATTATNKANEAISSATIATQQADIAKEQALIAKEEVAKLSNVYRFKGSVEDFYSLPLNADIGDVYDTLDTGMNYAWTGSQWDNLGGVFDVSWGNLKGDIENQTDLMSALGSKQDNLIEGDNIIIENNVISANFEKVDLSDYYTKTETYSQEEVDNLLSEKQDILTPTAPINIGTTTIGEPNNISVLNGKITPTTNNKIDGSYGSNTVYTSLYGHTEQQPTSFNDAFKTVPYFDIPVNFSSVFTEDYSVTEQLKVELTGITGTYSSNYFFFYFGKLDNEDFKPYIFAKRKPYNTTSTSAAIAVINGDMALYSYSSSTGIASYQAPALAGTTSSSQSNLSGSTGMEVRAVISKTTAGVLNPAIFFDNYTNGYKYTSGVTVTAGNWDLNDLRNCNVIRVVFLNNGSSPGLWPTSAGTTVSTQNGPLDWNIESGIVRTYGISLNYDSGTLLVNNNGQLAAKPTDLTSINNQLSTLNNDVSTLAGRVTTNEGGIVALETSKQNVISDLATIRTNAESGANAANTISGYGNIVTHNVSEFATSAQGNLADSALQSGDNITELVNNAGYITSIPDEYITESELSNELSAYAKKSEIPEGAIVDDAFSTISTNAVQNKVITNKLNQIESNIPTDFYTQGQVDNKVSELQEEINNKQDKLIAGDNVTIENNIISAQSGGSAVEIDNITITENATNKLQAIGVIDSNTSNAIKTWTGTKAQYDAIASKDGNTLYNITDDTDVTLTLLEALYPVGSIYIGKTTACPLQTLGVGTWEAKTSRFLVDKKEATAADPNWYNLYSDGWCEQGGHATASATYSAPTITNLPKSYKDNTYNISLFIDSSGSFSNASNVYIKMSNKTASSFGTLSGYNYNTGSAYAFNWQAAGYTSEVTQINQWERIS